MKFTYQYKTKDGTQHEGTYSAASRTAVYDELKKQGIKPFNVKLAPGFVNRLASFGKRGIAIAVLCIVCLALVVLVVRTRRDIEGRMGESLPRHQIYGDPALMAEIERNAYTNVFAHPGECLLARYAQPGYVMSATVAEQPKPATLADCLAHEIVIGSDDAREVAELKRIVNGMKDELRAYLADGVGTPETYVRRLNERLREELSIRYRIETELKRESDPAAIRKANESLRALGLRPIVKSEE